MKKNRIEFLSRLELSLLLNLCQVKKTGCGESFKQPIIKWDGWKDREDIIYTNKLLPNKAKFTADFSNLQKILDKLVEKKLIDFRKREYETRKKVRHMNEWRIKPNKSVFTKLYFLSFNQGFIGFFLTSDYYKRCKDTTEAFINDFFNDLTLSRIQGLRYYAKLNKMLLVNYPSIVCWYIKDKKKFLEVFKDLNNDILECLKQANIPKEGLPQFLLSSLLIQQIMIYRYEGEDFYLTFLKKDLIHNLDVFTNQVAIEKATEMLAEKLKSSKVKNGKIIIKIDEGGQISKR